MLQKNQEIQLEIDSVSNDGNGVARYDGAVVFVPFSAPGDLLQIKIVKAASRHAFGRILSVVRPSAVRITPDCASFGQCGGCAFRHLSYPAELAAKAAFVGENLRRIGRISPLIDPPVASPLLTGCRNKVQLPVFSDGGRLSFGFYAPRSHRIVPFAGGCRLEPPLFQQIAKTCCSLLDEQGISAYDERTHTGLLRHLVLRQSSGGSVMLCLVLNAPSLPDEPAFCGAVRALFPQISTVVLNVNRERTNVILGASSRALSGDGFLYDRLLDVSLRLSVHSFLQVNHAAAGLLYQKIASFADISAEETLLDLYCGAGSIGLSLAGRSKRLIGVEIVKEAVADAKYNARQNRIRNAKFFVSDAGQAARALAETGQPVDVIVTDPPRKGCDPETLDAIVRMNPSRIVMVSCDPATLARDLAVLHDRGYPAVRVTPVDLFPRTRHIESVALLQKAAQI